MTRILSCAALAASLVIGPPAHAADPFWSAGKTDTVHAITVYRSASCGCCKGWVSHLREHGFVVEDAVTDEMSPIKAQLGVSPDVASCHTAVADGHVFEGHVPANDIKAVLERDDAVRLLAAPGMPSGSPGMDYDGSRKDRFALIAVERDGTRRVYRTYDGY